MAARSAAELVPRERPFAQGPGHDRNCSKSPLLYIGHGVLYSFEVCVCATGRLRANQGGKIGRFVLPVDRRVRNAGHSGRWGVMVFVGGSVFGVCFVFLGGCYCGFLKIGWVRFHLDAFKIYHV